MDGLASRLSSVISSLGEEGHGSFDCSALGDPEAVSAMESFVSGWSHGRSEIVSGIETVQGQLRGAAEAYRRSDQGMAARLTSPPR